jgi:hypothetical protein
MHIAADKINWQVALGELSLIVIGILMALAIDSYAEQRADRAVADAYLTDLVTEVQTDSVHLTRNYERMGKLIDSASELLRLVESGDSQHDDPAGLLVASLAGEGLTRQPAVWEEMQMTGALRLIPKPSTRSAIVSHYLERTKQFKIIDENFVPAVRELRTLAWDLLPIESFGRYMNTSQSGVPGPAFMAELRSRENSTYLLKRVIVSGTVARLNLDRAAKNAVSLLKELGVDGEIGK